MADWENLRYFILVAEQGSVSGAARLLGVSHSTVLRRIDQFEDALGSKLFRRLQRGYELTEAGERLLEQSRVLAQQIERALADAEGRPDAAHGRLRISQPETGVLNLYPVYAEFRRAHPEITLEIHSTIVSHNLNQQEVDVALRLIDAPDDLLVGRYLGEIASRAYASESYLAQFPHKHDTGDYDWIMFTGNEERTRQRWRDLRVEQPNIVLYSDSMPDVVHAVLCGMGVAFLTEHEARNHDGLVPLYDARVTGTYPLWILTHRDLRYSERVQTFMRFIAENITGLEKP